MNEPSNFPCNFPCDDPYTAAVRYPPPPPAVRALLSPLPGFPCVFQPACSPYTDATPKRREIAASVSVSKSLEKKGEHGQQLGLLGRDLLYPEYAIHNTATHTVEDNAVGGRISNHTINTDLIHQNGLAMYDTHNLYGTSMFPNLSLIKQC